MTPFVDDAERNAPPAQFKEQTYVGDKCMKCKGKLQESGVLIVESTKKTDQVCSCSKWKTPMPARYIKSTFWTIGIFIQSTDA